MSTVDKMLIKGIRSFDPENTTVLTFFRPLTLIVGPNGAGKTTVIECLKNACTGELPPNSRSGQTFVHDPKVAGETETKGQIKLRFKTAAGKDVVCVRSFQLTQKASKMEYKAIESVLQTINAQTGEKVSLSYRCADMDREVPTLMGVSKAVLENVIFVHQDEANWPLAEPATLKKKFDDIFSATRYTKALEVIKKLHKEQAQDIKTFKLKLENLQIVKDAAYKLQESIESDKQKAARLHMQNRELEKTIEELRSRMNSTESSLKDLRKLQSQISTKKAMKDMLTQRRVKQLHDLEEESEDTDEELLTWQVKFEENIGDLRMAVEKIEREIKTATIEIETHGEEYTNTCKIQGRLQAEKEAFAKLKREHDSHIQQFFSEMNLGVVDTLPLNNVTAIGYVSRASERLDELKANFRKLQQENSREVEHLRETVQREVTKKIEVDSNIRATKEQQKRDQSRYSLLSEEIELLLMEVNKQEMDRADETEKALGEEASKASKQLLESRFESKIQTAKERAVTLEGERRSLQRKKDDIASASSERAALRIRKETLVQRENTFSERLKVIHETYKKLGRARAPDPKNLKSDVEVLISKHKEIVAGLQDDVREAEQEVVKVSSRLEGTKNTILKHEAARDAKKKFLFNGLKNYLQLNVDVSAFPRQLEEAVKLKEKRFKDRAALEGMRRFYEPFQTTARSNHVCPCCDRPFTTEEEDTFVNKQRDLQSRSEDHLREYQALCFDAEVKATELEKLRPAYEEYMRLSAEIIAAQKIVEELSSEVEKLKEVQDDQIGLLAHANVQLEITESLLVPSNDVDRLQREIQSLKKLVEDQELSLEAVSQNTESLDEVNSKLALVTEQWEEVRRNMEKLLDEQRHANDDLAVIKSRWQRARERKLEMAGKQETLSQKQKDFEELKEQAMLADNSMTALESEREPLARRIQSLERELQACKRKVAAEEEDRMKDVRVFERGVDKLQASAISIKKYYDSETEAKLIDVNVKLSDIKAKQKVRENEREELSTELNKKRELLGNQAQIKRNIDDNISYRQTLQSEKQAGDEIASLERDMLQIGDPQTVENDLKKLAAEEQSLLSSLNRSRGSVAVFESNMGKSKVELKEVKYKDIDKRYCSQLIQLKTTEMANKDLDKYYNALDKALMRFHALKMEEINKIIKELWQQTYRGQDIDYIEIRSDAEGVGTRSYSYRVIMRSGDAELEMRGRCSAGQKVLASLIIRLALAETFCLNCGILALDEPTTNLDTPNAESLASALLRIIEDRKAQENFQLIVITHDERFAQLIGQRQHAERYYRITKDDHQHSRIEVQEIFD